MALNDHWQPTSGGQPGHEAGMLMVVSGPMLESVGFLFMRVVGGYVLPKGSDHLYSECGGRDDL